PAEGRAVGEPGAGKDPRLGARPLHDVRLAAASPGRRDLHAHERSFGFAELPPGPDAAERRALSFRAPVEVRRREEYEPPAEVAEAPDDAVGVPAGVLLAA